MVWSTVAMILLVFCVIPFVWSDAFMVSRHEMSFQSQRRQCRNPFSLLQQYTIPPGRVEDIDEWVRLSSDSLKKFTGVSLLDVMEGVIDSLEEIHDNERYAVLSHGNQTDPIYNYFNKGALLQFEWPLEEIYSLPSRYSAPNGTLRSDRATMMKTVEEQNVRIIPTAIRQTKSGEQFQLHNVTLWNVYDKEGTRVGQTAIFDRTLIEQPLLKIE